MTKSSELWQFANDFYATGKVAKQLLALQNDYQLNVNQLIYAVWLSTFDYKLERLPAADENAASWRSNICIPLRTLRFELRRTKAQMTEQLDAVEACYQQMLAAELAAERVELDLLASQIENYAQANNANLAVDQLILKNIQCCCNASESLTSIDVTDKAIESYIHLATEYVCQ